MIPPKRVAILIQARMTSTRLPGKVLAPLAGRPAILWVVERARAVGGVGHCLLATSTDPSDDPLADLCRAEGIPCARGALQDVLGRMCAAVPAGVRAVVRLTGDCPLSDPALVELHLRRFAALHAGPRYVTNAATRTYPDGLDVEVMDVELLREADRRATDPGDREHVTPWIRRHAAVTPVIQAEDLSALRWVLDTPADRAVLDAMLGALPPGFGSAEVYRLLLQRPELVHLADATPVEEILGRIARLLDRGEA
jgi:spore coat polysaccharide biosynthesis protein SpsF (cytidylyltransferase family)